MLQKKIKFVITKTSFCRGSLNRDSTVIKDFRKLSLRKKSNLTMYKPLIKTLTLFLHSLDHFSMRSSSSVPAWITKYIHINIKTCQCTRTVVYWYWCLYLRWKETFGYPATNQAWTLCWLGIAGRPRGLVIHDIAIRRINNHPLNRVAYFVHAGHIGYWPSARSVWGGWILTKFLFFCMFLDRNGGI